MPSDRKPMEKPTVSRLDRIVKELERLHAEAKQIFDSHINHVVARHPGPAPIEVVKYHWIDEPAGRTLDYIAALKLVRCRVLGE
jgi:hypothetical protein